MKKFVFVCCFVHLLLDAYTQELSMWTCEDDTLSITCDDGFIQIKYANYGRLDRSTCGWESGWDDNCVADQSLTIVKDVCNGNTNCEIKASNDIFGDSCHGTQKYLEVRYSCKKDSEIPLGDKATSQSSTTHDGVPERAVDGDINGNYNSGKTCTHTDRDEQGAWWMVDLGRTIRIEMVVMYNRADCCKNRLSGATVRIGNDPTRNNPLCGTVSPEQTANGQQFTLLCDLSGQYLSIQVRPSEILTLCEVKIFEKQFEYPSAEIPLGDKTTSQSSLSSGGVPERAVDGNTNGNYEAGLSCTHTGYEGGAWWMVDLEKAFRVDTVAIYNRDNCCEERLDGAIVRIGDDPNRNNPICGTVTSQQVANGPEIILPCEMLVGQYLSIELTIANPLTLCEVKLYGHEYYTTTVLPTHSESNLTTLRAEVFDNSTDSTNITAKVSGFAPALVSVIVIVLILLTAVALWVIIRRRSRSRKDNSTPASAKSSATFENSYQTPDPIVIDNGDGYTGLSKEREESTYAELKTNPTNNDANYYETFGDNPGPSGNGMVDIYAESQYGGCDNGLVDVYAESQDGGRPMSRHADNEYSYVTTPGPDVPHSRSQDNKTQPVLDPDDEEYCVVR